MGALFLNIRKRERKMKENKYQWHDLRKNPDDLPKKTETMRRTMFLLQLDVPIGTLGNRLIMTTEKECGLPMTKMFLHGNM